MDVARSRFLKNGSRITTNPSDSTSVSTHMYLRRVYLARAVEIAGFSLYQIGLSFALVL